MRNNKRQAFTFAELMIVVSIIGVIASFMIPALVRSEPNETALTYKKTFHAIEQAVRNSINDITLYPPLREEIEGAGRNPIHPADIFNEGDLRYTVVRDANNIITSYVDDANAEFLCRNLAENLNTVGAIRCTEEDGRVDLNMDGTENLTAATTNFTLSNGATVGGISYSWTRNDDNGDALPNDTPPFITLCIDFNGNLPPNVGCAIADRANPNRDQFRIRLNAEGKVYTGAPVGPNNWFSENRMLINPRAVTRDQRPLTDREEDELTNANDATVIGNTLETCPQELGYVFTANRCVYTAGYTEAAILRRRQ